MRQIVRVLSILGYCLLFLLITVAARLVAGSGVRGWRLAGELHRLWALGLLRILGVKVYLQGEIWRAADGRSGCLIVSNHLSYLDIAVISSFFPAVFIAKSEVADWPLLGWLARLGGTLFLRRGETESSVECFYKACARLRRGVNIAIFPEGTTTDGRVMAPFQPFFLASAIRCRRPVLPLRIEVISCQSGDDGSELSVGEALDVYCWYGEQSFLPHFWRLLSMKSIEVSLTAAPVLGEEFQERADELVEVVTDMIAAGSAAITGEGEEISIDFLAGAVLLSMLDLWGDLSLKQAASQGGVVVERGVDSVCAG